MNFEKRSISLYIALYLLMFAMTLANSQVYASGNQQEVSVQQAQAAYEYALKYVQNDVAYLYGGRLGVDQYLAELSIGREPGVEIGVDASALVVNAYRSAVPSLRFWFDDSQTTMVADATSTTIAEFNSRPLSQDELVPGDLVFFTDAGGRISGMGIFSQIQGNVIHFITASATAGKVILTNAYLTGEYWANVFAGYGRLVHPH